MTARPIIRNPRLAAFLIVALIAGSPGRSSAQGHGGGSKRNSSDNAHGDGATGPNTPEPYEGQIYCPVTGKKLGLTQPPVAVQTTIGEKQPGFWGKMFGQKTSPGAVIYVSGPECVDAVRRDPMPYLEQIVLDKSCFNFTYAKAPAQRPPRVRDDSEPAPDVAQTSSSPFRPPSEPAPSPLAGPPPALERPGSAEHP